MSSRILHTESAAPNTIRNRRVRNILTAIIVPVLVAIAYLAGTSGADARTSALPALIVNEDQMVEQTAADGTTTPVVAGRLLVTALAEPENAYGFSWGLANAETAEAALASGDAYVVVTIPSDFSASVVSLGTNEPTPANISVTTDQAHDYLAGQAASSLTSALTAAFGTEITQMVAIGLAEGFAQTGDALDEAADGATQLQSGANQLGTGFDTYSQGQQQITDGLAASAEGAGQLADGVTQYTEGVGELSSGVSTYTSGVSTYVSGVGEYTAGVDSLAGTIVEAGSAIPADQLATVAASGPQVEAAADAYDQAKTTYDESVEPALANAEATAESLRASCAMLPEEADRATCVGQVDELAGGATEAKSVLDAVFGADLGNQLRQIVPILPMLPDIVNGAVSGAQQLIAAGEQLRSGGTELTDGGTTLTSGAGTLSTAGTELETGASELSSGLVLLSDGQSQLAASNPELRNGMTQLAGGAGDLSTGLRSGADEARDALGDPTRYGEALANPVVATLVSQHSPGFGGMLLAIVLPLIVWLAALVTMLLRRTVTRDELASTGTNARLLGRALRKLALPVAVVAVLVTIIGHVWAGVPAAAILGTMTVGLLLAGAVAGLHVLFVALWGRRSGAIASLAFLAVQVLAVRGFVPMEFRASWLDALAVVSPLAHASAGLQLVYAGGAGGSIAQALLSIALIGVIALAAAGIVIGRRRATTLARVVDLRSLAVTNAA
ncbi:hypothetical protein F8O01_06265 [Pseudoclavibacter chungangensis]|uniref:YhgE/Pip domain-containing protein n=1 Tax=Pseudoclavibacter chungangensis TaxID=587635 RepID=A0A7J5C044_9MICO|nr:hypothetical protein [Pseudoclavibacter chungangensis]KAB1659523.1 hypothetical protein F8O01_06265 [Pseudoclavibacter chungangensis]NYJ67614.1 putative membrane protein [Pseudoclavibacter chungangensis]